MATNRRADQRGRTGGFVRQQHVAREEHSDAGAPRALDHLEHAAGDLGARGDLADHADPHVVDHPRIRRIGRTPASVAKSIKPAENRRLAMSGAPAPGSRREVHLDLVSAGCGSGRFALAGASSRRPSLAPRVGSHWSQVGKYQFRSPSSFIDAGSNTARTTVASRITATASPTPACLRSIELAVANSENTPNITSAALVTTPAVRAIPK